MEFENTFTVPAPIEEVYAALLDLERVAPAMPGAQVLEKTGDDSYKVAIKVKLGPVSMTYRGDVTIVETDAATHTATLDVKAKEARGQGTATAKVEMALAEDGAATTGTMKAGVQLSGKAAAMGRGIIEDVSKRLVATFAENLAGIIEAEPGAAEEAATNGAPADAPAPPEPEPEAAPKPKAGPPPPGPKAPPKPKAEPPPPPPKPEAGPPPPAADDEGLPVLPLAAGILADRMRDPRVLAGVLGGTALLGYLVGRRSR